MISMSSKAFEIQIIKRKFLGLMSNVDILLQNLQQFIILLRSHPGLEKSSENGKEGYLSENFKSGVNVVMGSAEQLRC